MGLELGKNPGGRPRGHGVSYYIAQILEKSLPDGINKKQRLAEKLVDMALSDETSSKDFLAITEMIMDRLEGKPVNTNLNADVSANPFEGIDSEKLEALKTKLQECLPKK